jgi:hypothetical protein
MRLEISIVDEIEVFHRGHENLRERRGTKYAREDSCQSDCLHEILKQNTPLSARRNKYIPFRKIPHMMQ